jgi:hypothetical protein
LTHAERGTIFRLQIVDMPFTLAHPAAILPLRRFCPRYLSFTGLVVGSVVPDASYCFGPLHVDVFAHRFVGIFGFALPAGMAMLLVFYLLRQGAVEWLPENQRRIFEPLCRKPPPPIWVLAVSVVIGAFTHIVWDSFTHQHGWLVERLPALQMPLLTFANHRMLVCHFLWYFCSFVGVAWVCFAYEQWRQGADPQTPRFSIHARLAKALLVGLLVLPIEVVHHLVTGSMGFAMVGLCSLALVLVVALNFGNPLPKEL